jgi:hypothetical protein
MSVSTLHMFHQSGATIEAPVPVQEGEGGDLSDVRFLLHEQLARGAGELSKLRQGMAFRVVSASGAR